MRVYPHHEDLGLVENDHTEDMRKAPAATEALQNQPSPKKAGHHSMTQPPDPLSVFCPLCLARPGDPCEEVRLGWITAAPEPHPIRVRAAEEVARG